VPFGLSASIQLCSAVCVYISHTLFNSEHCYAHLLLIYLVLLPKYLLRSLQFDFHIRSLSNALHVMAQNWTDLCVPATYRYIYVLQMGKK
jgi:hypothetical protein